MPFPLIHRVRRPAFSKYLSRISSIRSDASNDRLIINTDVLNYNLPYTVMFWLQLVVDQNAITSFLVISDTTASNMDNIRTSATGTLLQIRMAVGGTTSNPSGTDLVAGTWYHLALVRESSTSLKLYVNGQLDITNTQDITGRVANTDLRFLGRSATTDPSNCRIALPKMWAGYGMNLAEVQRERLNIEPQRAENIYGGWLLSPGDRDEDYSGYRHHFTRAGTLTYEEGPPVGWKVMPTAAKAAAAAKAPPPFQRPNYLWNRRF